MITNAAQYRAAKTRYQGFAHILGLMQALAEPSREALAQEIANFERSLAELCKELKEYDELLHGINRIEETSFENLAHLLIATRIAAGLTQKGLAERLGLKEQQIQRYEATHYQAASLARLYEVVAALGLNLTIMEK